MKHNLWFILLKSLQTIKYSQLEGSLGDRLEDSYQYDDRLFNWKELSDWKQYYHSHFKIDRHSHSRPGEMTKFSGFFLNFTSSVSTWETQCKINTWHSRTNVEGYSVGCSKHIKRLNCDSNHDSNHDPWFMGHGESFSLNFKLWNRNRIYQSKHWH